MWFAIAVATATGALSMFAILPFLRRAALVDHPNHRSMHRSPTPRGGGIAVGAGVSAGFLVALADGSMRLDVIAVLCFAAASVMSALGFVDDAVGLSARARLLAQLVLGSAIATTAVALSTSTTWLIIIAPVAGALWVAAFVNAFNFMDGINGISGLTSVVAGSWYAYLGWHLDDPALLLGGLLAGAAIGFLPWNLPRARAFLGDVGSYGIGALLACLALDTAIRHDAPLAAIAPLILYIADTGITLLRRLVAGAQLTEAHREHAYQRAVALGPSHGTVAAYAAAASGLICLVVRFTRAPSAELVVAGILSIYLETPTLIQRFKRVP